MANYRGTNGPAHNQQIHAHFLKPLLYLLKTRGLSLLSGLEKRVDDITLLDCGAKFILWSQEDRKSVG